MQTIKAKVQVKADRTLTAQLPAETQAGEYEIELVLKSNALSGTQPSKQVVDGFKESDGDEAWENWLKEVEQLPISPSPVEGDYQQHIIEKYRKQGLEL